jgi:hypothetical protein
LQNGNQDAASNNVIVSFLVNRPPMFSTMASAAVFSIWWRGGGGPQGQFSAAPRY